MPTTPASLSPSPTAFACTGMAMGEAGGALVAPIGACFILSWEHHYDIFVHSDLFYRLRRQAQHAVHGPVSVAAKQAMVAGTSAETALAAQELAQLMAE